jgi:hypothetical protein
MSETTYTGTGRKPVHPAHETSTGVSENEANYLNIIDELRAELTIAHAELSDMTADRDSERRWADQYARERDQAQEEIERLRGIILNATCVTQNWPGGEIRLCCDSGPDEEHEPECSFYQWEGDNAKV